MTDIIVGGVTVSVVPDAKGWDRKLKDQIIEPSRKAGEEAGRELGQGIDKGMGKAGAESADDFSKTFKARLKAALDSLPKAKLDGDTSAIDADLDEIRRKIAAIHDERVINPAKASDDIARIILDLDRLKSKAHGIDLSFDIKKAQADLLTLRASAAVTARKSGAGITSGQVSAATGVLGNIMGLLGVIGGGGRGGGGGGAGGAGEAAGKGPAPFDLIGLLTNNIIGKIFLGPQAALTVPLTAYVGQIVSGGLVAGFGSALAGIGIFGALRNAGAQKAFSSFTGIAGTALTQVGTPFIQPVKSVLGTAANVLQANVPTFTNAISTISSPLQDFVNTVLNAFKDPAVQKSVQAVADSFAQILNAITPDVTKGMESIANSITSMANAVAANPQAFANFVNFLFGIVNFGFRALAVLTGISNWFEKSGGVFGSIENFFKSPFGNQPVNWATNPLGGIIAALGSFLTPGGAVNKQLMKIGGDIWNGILSGIDAAVKDTGKWITTNVVDPFIHWMTAGFGIGSPAKVMIPIGKDIVAGLLAGILTAWTNVKNFFTKTVPTDLLNWFKDAKTWLIQAGKDILTGLKTGFDAFWNSGITAWFKAVPGKIKDFFNTGISGAGKAINWLWNEGWDVISGFFQGIISMMSTVDIKWVTDHIYTPLVNVIKDKFGIPHGSAAAMIPIGKEIITGIIHGMISEGKHLDRFVADIFGSWPKALLSAVTGGGISLKSLPKAAFNVLSSLFGPVANLPGKAIDFFQQAVNSGGRGVTQWTGTVSRALSMLRLPQSLSGRVLYQIQTESGGNPNAINLTDANARRGDPSRGLLQTTGGTFSQYHVPGTAFNIYDPLANIAAAINYAVHRYGSSLMRGGAGLGSGHGYDTGGWLPSGVTMAYNLTGRPERILSPDELRAFQAGGGPTYVANFDGLTGTAIEQHVRTAFQVMSITQGNLQRQGRRS